MNSQDESAVTLKGAGKPEVRTISRKAIVCFVVGVAFVGCLAIGSIFGTQTPDQKKEQKKTENNNTKVQTSEIVSDLPDNYEGLNTASSNGKRPVVNTPNVPGFLLGDKKNQMASTQPALPPEKTQVEKLHEQQEADRAKEEYEAIHSKITFANNGENFQPKVANAPLPGDQATVIEQIMKTSQATGSVGNLGRQINGDRDNSNRQDDKSDFSNKKRTTDPYLKQGMVTPTSPYYISQGTIIPAVLLTGINSDLPGQISGQVSQDVFDTTTGNYLIIPQGSKLTGEYNSVVTYGQERVQVVWTRVIRPDGTSINLENMPGADLAGYSGLSDQVNNHWGKLLAGVAMSSILGAGAQLSQGSTYNQANPSFGQLATQGASQNVNQVGQQITQKNLEIQPTLEIRPGMRFIVYVAKDVELPVYETAKD